MINFDIFFYAKAITKPLHAVILLIRLLSIEYLSHELRVSFVTWGSITTI